MSTIRTLLIATALAAYLTLTLGASALILSIGSFG
jgi:hypothetical protein